MTKKSTYEELEEKVKELEKEAADSRRTRKVLHETRRYLEDLFNYANVPIVIWDSNCRIKQLNHAFEHLAQKSVSEVLGTCIASLFPGNQRDKAMAQVLSTNANERWKDIEIPILCTDGTVRTVLWNSAVLYAKDGKTAIAVIAQGRDITERKKAEAALKDLNKKLIKESDERKRLSKRLIELLEKDRQRIARELHDHLGQTLTVLKMELEIICGKMGPADSSVKGQIESAIDRVIQSIKEIRKITHGLRPSVLDDLGLVPAVRALLDDFGHRVDIEIHFFTQGLPERFEPKKELAIYRIIQEAMINILKHAKATEVFVNLIKNNMMISLNIEDNGIGFDQKKVMTVPERRGRMGLRIMRERVTQLSGEFSIESRIGGGTHLLVEIPFNSIPRCK